MDKPTTVAWIFLAVEMASMEEPANRRSISMLADGINHAIPTNIEMDISLRWLETADLVSRDQKGYIISPAGRKVLEKARADIATVSAVWKRLTEEITRIYNQTKSN
ncbi:MAG TPA: hypothetical protein VL325_07385 [Pyrinomonadaceae bacterium]|jgi:hypothetical protein|nr:hypothetical protein [Pyrinomonadaceae bacterium]